MVDDNPDSEDGFNRRSILKSIGVLGGSTTALGFASRPGSAKLAEELDESFLDVDAMREAFATHGQPILEELSRRGFIESPTPRALDIQQVAVNREDDETTGHLSKFVIDGEAYTGIDTLVTTETATAVVSVVPGAEQAMASISPDSGEGLLIKSTGDDSLSTTSHGSCEGSKQVDSCGNLCQCNNVYEYYYMQRWSCSCGDGCTHAWNECPDAFGEPCTESKAWPCG